MRKVGLRLSSYEIRDGLEVRRVQAVAVDLKRLEVVTLGPHIDFSAVHRAVPVHGASMQRATERDGLHCAGVAKMTKIAGVNDISSRRFTDHNQPATGRDQEWTGSVQI